MKRGIFFLLWILFPNSIFAQDCKEDSSTNRIEGDFDGHGKKEGAWLSCQKIGVSSLTYFVNFSNSKIKKLQLDACYDMPIIKNEGDLNNKKGDEISVILFREQGCWHTIEVYTYEKQRWKKLASASVHCQQLDDNVDFVRKSKKKGYFEVQEANFNDEMTDTFFKYKKFKIK